MSCHPNHQEKIYTCPMHPNIRQNKKGKCVKCGMSLEEVKNSKLKIQNDTAHSNHHHAHHDHENMMASPEAASDFLRRFIIVTFLLIPLVLLTQKALNFLGIGDFFLRKYLQFGLATFIFYYALIFFEHAKHEIKMGKYGMMTLVSLAVGAGYLFSAASTFLPSLNVEFYLEISSLIWVLLFGHYLEAKSSSAAGDALQEVAKLLPKQAHRLKIKSEKLERESEEEIEDVDITNLRKGDLVLVKAGEKVPADGEIVKGEANFNEAHISGESKPVGKKVGDSVVAGSICIDGSVYVKLNRVGENSTIGQIHQLIAEAQKTKPTAQKIADKAASWLTFTALSVGIITILVWTLIIGKPFVFAITLAITVLVIACPHALGLAIPTVSTIATTLAAKNGLFIKDLGKLEVVKGVDYAVLDKTGTLTKGEFGVTDVLALKHKSEKPKLKSPTQSSKLTKEQKKVVEIASSLETHSSHVIGQSIVKFAKEKNIKPKKAEKFKDIAGKGIIGTIKGKTYYVGNLDLIRDLKLVDGNKSNKDGHWQIKKSYEELSNEGKTVVFVANNTKVLGLIALADQIKPQSYTAIEKLHQLGVKVAMLTGDNEQVAQSVAKQLNIDSYFANVKPDEKYEKIKKLQDEGNKVMMVGDGVNDAPALTQADAGVAIGAGTDVAVEAGDIVLTRNNPEDVVRLIILSRKVYRKMQENLVWATAYNVIAIPAAAGIFAPWGFFLRPEIGAILMALSSVIVVINALLLKRINLQLE